MEKKNKYCPRCKEELPVGAFYKNLYNKSGLSCYCIECCKNLSKENRNKYKEMNSKEDTLVKKEIKLPWG